MIRLLAYVCLAITVECHTRQETYTIYAASSLAGTLDQAIEELNLTSKIQVVYGSSSQLARQLEAGASADLFISAHDRWTKRVHTALPVMCLWSNQLVIASSGPRDNVRIAMGDPVHVPQGMYGRQALTSMNLWKHMEHRIVPAPDARTCIRYLSTGMVAYAVVYKSDAIRYHLHIHQPIDSDTHDPIRYQAVFLDPPPEWFTSLANSDVFGRQGFQPCR